MTETENRRGWSYHGAVEAGLEPRLYDWKNIPDGIWKASLDYRYWADNGGPGALVCCFSTPEGMRYRISAFRQKDGRYTPKDNGVDFGEKGIDGRHYMLNIGKTRNGKLAWLGASLASAEDLALDETGSAG
jgi:hypothetical protein